jgi:hypothetical protein
MSQPLLFTRLSVLAVIASVYWLLAFTTVATAVEPTIRAINIRGLQIGGTTELICDGDDFTTEPKLLLPFAAEQELKTGSTDKKATFSVKLPNDIEPGYYQLRIATVGGVSLPIVIGVDRLPQLAFAPLIEKLPVSAFGSVSGSAIIETKFNGKKDETVTIEIEAQRLGSKLRPVIHLYDAKGKQLAWAWSQPALFGDARLEVTLPADGEYRVTCHDLEYAAPSPNFFRLKMGQWTRVEQVFPFVIATGGAKSVEVRTQVAAQKQTVDAAATGQVLKLSAPAADFSGPRSFVRVSSQREFVEAAGQSDFSLATGSLGISGELSNPQEEDRYKLTVKPGDKIRCEVFAQRNGSAIDARILIRNDQDAVLATGEDSAGSLDPVLEYTVPDKVEVIRVCVTDSQGRGGTRNAYHLTLRNLNDTAATLNDFRLHTNIERAAISKAGQWVLPIWLDRRGYQGPVEITANALPAGLALTGTTIAAGCDGTLVTITADNSEPPQLAAVSLWQGKAISGITSTVALKNHPLEAQQPWLAEEIAIARVNTPAADFAIDWRDLPTTATLQPTAKLPLPIKITRVDEKAPVRLSLLTSQLAPLNNNQPDPNKTLRVEKAVELGATMHDGEVTLVVPAELASDAYDVAVQAELLSADKQRVLATSFTPVRRLAVQLPVEVILAGEPRFDVMLDPAKGATQKIEGTIKRREGIAGDVVITVAGLPAGVRADSPTLKAEENNFSLTITLPTNQAAGEIGGLKVTAAIAPDPKQANVRVKSREVELKLNVLQPAT